MTDLAKCPHCGQAMPPPPPAPINLCADPYCQHEETRHQLKEILTCVPMNERCLVPGCPCSDFRPRPRAELEKVRTKKR